jgi:hypothetical protein
MKMHAEKGRLLEECLKTHTEGAKKSVSHLSGLLAQKPKVELRTAGNDYSTLTH